MSSNCEELNPPGKPQSCFCLPRKSPFDPFCQSLTTTKATSGPGSVAIGRLAVPVLGLHGKVSGLFHWGIMVLYMCVCVLCIHIILFIYLFLVVLGLLCRADFSLVVASRSYSPLEVHGWLLSLWNTGSRRTGFSSWGTWAQSLRLPSSRTQLQ